MAASETNIYKREFSVVVKDPETPGPDKMLIHIEANDGVRTYVGNTFIPWEDDNDIRLDAIMDAVSAELTVMNT